MIERVTIYATQDARHVNLTPALDHGDRIVAMTPSGDANFSPSDTVARLHDVFDNFQPGRDKVLMVGDPLVMMMVGAVYRDRFDEPLKVLKWDRMANRYIEIEIDFNIL